MAFVGNLLWFVFVGLWLGLLWCCAGLFCLVTVVLIPFGIACFRIARFAAFPFGKDLVPAEMLGEKRIFGTGLLNLIWVICFGFWLALAHALYGIVLCCFIVTIPWGIACFNISKASFAPLGNRIVTKEMAKVAREQYAKAKLDAAFAKK